MHKNVKLQMSPIATFSPFISLTYLLTPHFRHLCKEYLTQIIKNKTYHL